MHLESRRMSISKAVYLNGLAKRAINLKTNYELKSKDAFGTRDLFYRYSPFRETRSLEEKSICNNSTEFSYQMK